MIAPIAAKQGAHNKLNIINENAPNLFPPKISCPIIASSLLPSSTSSNATSAFPIDESEPKTPTTSSFATNPKIVATADCQLPKPNGANIYAIVPPINSNIDFPPFSSVI